MKLVTYLIGKATRVRHPALGKFEGMAPGSELCTLVGGSTRAKVLQEVSTTPSHKPLMAIQNKKMFLQATVTMVSMLGG